MGMMFRVELWDEGTEIVISLMYVLELWSLVQKLGEEGGM